MQKHKIVLTLVLSSLMLFTGLIFQLVQNTQKDPYMDEIFHIPQAQQYCKSNFSHWDPMITTLPGLYITSVALLYAITFISGATSVDICTTYNLRAINMIFCVGNFVLLYVIGKRLNKESKGKDASPKQLLLNSTVLLLFPVLYFFSWLYYTDPGSTFFTLLMYSLCIYEYHKLSSLSGIVAILFRQTNVIWVLFCFALAGIKIIEKELQSHSKRGLQIIQNLNFLKLPFQSILNPATDLCIIKSVLIQTYSYILLMVGFIVFVINNKGIVVGDRSNHVASCNFPQVFYFLLVSFLFSFFNFFHIKFVLAFVYASLKNPFKVLLFVFITAIMIKYFTYEHKYLLSDNRHYTFYIWSKLFKRFYWMRYALIPAYLFSLYLFYNVTGHRGILWQLSLFLCTAACLVPQSLLEFRYYIIPFFIIRLNMKLPPTRILLAELITYIFLNAFTIYMFISKPFHWINDPKPQRFMW